MASAVRSSAAAGLGHVTTTELDLWLEDLDRQRERGTFFVSETAYLVDAQRG
jgi:hypothetical protein